MLSIQELSISLEQDTVARKLVDNISFEIQTGETVALIGESGSGKSLTAASILRLLPDNLVTKGRIRFHSADKITQLNTCDEPSIRKIRGSDIAMIFQEPMTSLNPLMRCGQQIQEAVTTHTSTSKKNAQDQTIMLLSKMGLKDPQRIFNSYPHQLSGGQKQRVMIAMAMACQPKLLIADEPTTALDVTVQKEILELLECLKKEHQISILLVTHDMGIVADYANRVLVMQSGKIIESGKANEIMLQPKQEYTKSLIQPFSSKSFNKLLSCTDKIKGNTSLLSIKKLTIQYPNKQNPYQPFTAVDQVSFDIAPGEIIGLAGESGSGKSSLGKALVGLVEKSTGEICFMGKELSSLSRNEIKQWKQKVQMVFQDPYGSLNPKMKIGKAILEVMRFHERGENENDRSLKLQHLLEKLGLQPNDAHLYPHQFSGGQRQRISILRALATEPQLLIFDEAISALDSARQKIILDLLMQLKSEFGFASLFISHDLRALSSISDRILIMKSGRLLQLDQKELPAYSEDLQYVKELLNAVPGQSISIGID